jgi:hypothetical protein
VAEVEDSPPDEDSVRRWRHEQFLRLGFVESQATLLADCTHVDLGQVRRLAGQGCSLDTLVKIVV